MREKSQDVYVYAFKEDAVDESHWSLGWVGGEIDEVISMVWLCSVVPELSFYWRL